MVKTLLVSFLLEIPLFPLAALMHDQLYRNFQIQSVDISQTCNNDFDPRASTNSISGFEKLHVGKNKEERNPLFDNLNKAIFNDVVHSLISVINNLESGNVKKEFSKDMLDTKPMEPLQESSGSKQSVSFNRASSSFEKDEMVCFVVMVLIVTIIEIHS
ncbi:hypothetical protein TNCV_1072701 [Trichonephila clavipes]|nr:hypothetical protein TNCV_1072701 [Trichonephila clavipes]